MKDTPKITYCMKKASAEKDILAMIEEALDNSGLPCFMRVDILRAALITEQQKAYDELANDSEVVLKKVTEHFEGKLKEMADAAEKEKQELIEAFENPGSDVPEDVTDDQERSD